jgi:hypothetical protein
MLVLRSHPSVDVIPAGTVLTGANPGVLTARDEPLVLTTHVQGPGHIQGKRGVEEEQSKLNRGENIDVKHV